MTTNNTLTEKTGHPARIEYPTDLNLDPHAFIERMRKEHGSDVSIAFDIDFLKELMDKARIAYGEAYEGLVEQMRQYVDLRPEYYPIVALWIIGTYAHDRFHTYPFMYFNAMRGSGKTRLLKFIASCAYKANGEVQTGVSEAVLFRSEKGATLLFDECESIASREKATLREYLNACYKKGATVKRVKKVKTDKVESYAIEVFHPYRPIAMANINGMNSVLQDRCLTLILEKSNNPHITKLMENFEYNTTLIEINRTLLRFSDVVTLGDSTGGYIQSWNAYIQQHNSTTLPNTTQPHVTPLTAFDMNMLSFFNTLNATEINGRNLELIFPLLMLAYWMSEDLCNQVLQIFINMIGEKREDEYMNDRDVSFIQFIATLDKYQLSYVPNRLITSEFKDFMQESDDDEHWLNSKWVGNALKRLGLIGTQRKLSQGKEYILAVGKAKDKMKMFKHEESSGDHRS